MPEPGDVLAEIYNAQGSTMNRALEPKKEVGDVCTIDFDGSHLPNGLYFIRVTTKRYLSIKKLLYIKSNKALDRLASFLASMQVSLSRIRRISSFLSCVKFIIQFSCPSLQIKLSDELDYINYCRII